MNKLKIIFFGTPEFVISILESLHKNFEVIGVVTGPDTIQGRKKILTPTPVKKYSLEKDLKIFDNLDQLQNIQCDLIVVAAFGKIISKKILEIPKYGSLNIHPSMLPKFRGASPIQSAILDGLKMTGISIIKMDDKMDHGPIVSQWEYPINDTDTFQSLHYAMFEDAAKKLPGIIKDFIDHKISLAIQDENEVTICDRIAKEDGYFDITNPPPPRQLDLMIRAFYPWPTAWTKLQMTNKEWKIVKFLPEKIVQFEGGKPMKIKEAINGYPELKVILEQLLG